MLRFENPLAAFASPAALSMGRTASAGRLDELTGFGRNPGNLLARVHIPDGLPERAPLIVILHGCTQNADSYDRGSGWSELADEHGFAVLFPEQQRANNPNLCFNWFRPGDARRGRGEAASIRQMIAHLVGRHDLDDKRIFVAGLSAGGAMTSVMLAAYPDVFAGGAVIAGLPFATANSIPEALDRMRGNGGPGRAELAELVAKASPHEGDWPSLSVWHGTADATVNPVNADAIIDQWTALQQLPAVPTATETVDGQRRDVWRNKSGREVIERFTIVGLGHGTPLATDGEDGCGAPGPHMLEAAINSTRHIARFWGLVGVAKAKAILTVSAAPTPTPAKRAHTPNLARRLTRPPFPRKLAGVAEIIDKALRSAGLLR
ncbi:MAG: PHB depolymerase family esterase [Pseudomonadota bacterium]|nr:PHB depolymerase family esterase [Pseudomonadota bacterium]